MSCIIWLFFFLLKEPTAAPRKGIVIGVVQTTQHLKLVAAKGGSGRDKAIEKVVDQGKWRGKHIKQDLDADEVSNSLVNSSIKVIDM